MQISPKVEEPTRALFGHAIRGEYDDFGRALADLDQETLGQSLRLTSAIAATIALDDNDGRQLDEAEVHELAESVAELEARIEITTAEVHRYLAWVVFGGQQLTDVFSADDAVRLPYIITGVLLGSNADTEQGKHWWDYLDKVEAAIEATPEPNHQS